MKFIKFLIGIMAVLLLITISCDKKGDILGEEDLCSLVNISSNGDISISGCATGGAFSATISNIKYDQYGRRKSYNFDITCGSGDRYYGSVSLNYNNIGQVISSAVTINGQTCSF